MKLLDSDFENRILGYNECFDLYIQCAYKANDSGSFDWKSSSNTLLVLRSREENMDRYDDKNDEKLVLSKKSDLSPDDYDKFIMNRIMKTYNSYCLSNVLGFDLISVNPYQN